MFLAPSLKGIVFDLDGTLVDSRLDFPRMRADIGVPAEDGILEYIETLASVEEKHRANEILRRHELAGAHAATVIDGVTEFLDILEQRSLKTGVFTRNDKTPTELVIDRFFKGRFSAVITRDDAPAKPDPTGLLKICEQWACHPSEVAYVGDYLFDLDAGIAAGMKTILYISDEPWPSYTEKADFVIRKFSELNEDFEDIFSRRLGFSLS
jgi:HAD superfamily hydrolase (TIGR01509 family)